MNKRLMRQHERSREDACTADTGFIECDGCGAKIRGDEVATFYPEVLCEACYEESE